MLAVTCFVMLITTFLHMRSSKNEFIKPAGRVKLAVLKNYDLRRVPGLCKYGHIYIPAMFVTYIVQTYVPHQ